jgi:energy-converting hydrogenase Eha subunit B
MTDEKNITQGDKINGENTGKKGGTIPGRFIPLLFGFVILSFFFSFLEFSCDGKEYAELSGTDLVFGIDKSAIDIDSPDASPTTMEIEPDIYVVLAFAFAVIGFSMLFIRRRLACPVTFFSGFLGALSLLLFQWISLAGNDDMEINLLPAYWTALSIFALIVLLRMIYSIRANRKGK